MDNMGLDEDFTVGSDKMKNPRGILKYALSGRDQSAITKLTGNLGGEDYQDKAVVRSMKAVCTQKDKDITCHHRRPEIGRTVSRLMASHLLVLGSTLLRSTWTCQLDTISRCRSFH
jgi:hypothetical protein